MIGWINAPGRVIEAEDRLNNDLRWLPVIPVTFARDAVAITTSGLHWGRSLVDQPRTLRNPGVKALWPAMVPVGVAFYLVERSCPPWAGGCRTPDPGPTAASRHAPSVSASARQPRPGWAADSSSYVALNSATKRSMPNTRSARSRAAAPKRAAAPASPASRVDRRRHRRAVADRDLEARDPVDDDLRGAAGRRRHHRAARPMTPPGGRWAGPR